MESSEQLRRGRDLRGLLYGYRRRAPGRGGHPCGQRVRSTLLVALLLCLAGGCRIQAPASLTEPSETRPGEVPFRLAGTGGAAVLVPVRINGKGPYNLVLDTGATFTCLDQELARELNLRPRAGVSATGVGARSAGTVQLVGVKSLQVGTATASDVTACVLDLKHTRQMGLKTDGLLGLNFLRAFRVTIDFRRKVLSLEKPQ